MGRYIGKRETVETAGSERGREDKDRSVMQLPGEEVRIGGRSHSPAVYESICMFILEAGETWSVALSLDPKRALHRLETHIPTISVSLVTPLHGVVRREHKVR